MELVLLCLKIFIARIVDVTLATFDTVLKVKGKRIQATIVGFLDVVIWFLVVKEAINTNLKSPWIVLAYAGGYAIGTFSGTTLCNNLIRGKVSVQVIISEKLKDKVKLIRDAGFAVTTIKCDGMNNENKLMLLIETDNRNIKNLSSIVKSIDNKAFLIVNETKYVENGFFS